MPHKNGKTVRIFVSGRVQGVFFRAFVRDNALYLKLNGWARNVKDGRVEILACGEIKNLHELIKRVNSGSVGANVEGVSVEWLPYDSKLGRFDIKPTAELQN